jgi:hypothetical protein
MALCLKSSELYINLLKYCDDENKIKEKINKKIKELNFNDEVEVNYFLDNYKIISYNKNNIMKYMELLKYFRYNITKNVISHIFEKYFFDVIDNIIDNDAIEIIKIISLTWEFKKIINKYYELININGKSWTKNKLNNF